MSGSRREFLQTTLRLSLLGTLPGGALPAVTKSARPADAQPAAARPGEARPISREERQGRLAKVQGLMSEQKVSALLIEPGASLEYFTGIQWRRSERSTVAIIPAVGSVIVVAPAFEEPSVRETFEVAGDIRPWDEHESPFEKIVQCLRDRGIASGTLAAESTMRFFIIAGVRQVSASYEIIPADAMVRACRLIKSPAEIALMQVANDITLAALKILRAQTAKGMTGKDLGDLMTKTTIRLGGTPEFSLALLNEASAYPHGSVKPQVVHEGSIILMDCGCSIDSYQSDISRTWVYGEPSAKQRKVWQTVKQGQELALQTAKLGVPVGVIDDAVRGYYQSEGWGPGYHLPGLPHRTGHGIGLDGHEAPYLVHGDATPLAAGMCFSDEPGIYIPGEFGVRLEDCWYMTADGPRTFTPLAKSIDDPV
jgi:Xaa-Pro dipeptidase